MKNNLKSLTVAALTVVAIGLTACTATGTLTAPTGAQLSSALLSAGDSIQDTFTSIQTSAKLLAIGSDLQAYRAESDPTDDTVWVVYYWSPSQGKSYRCRESSSTKQVIDITQTTDATQIYQQNYTFDNTKVTVTPQAAAATAVTSINNSTNNSNNTTTTNNTATTNTTNNITINNITNVQVISPKEYQDRTGHANSNPVYVFVTSNNKSYVDASTGASITTTSATATPAPAASATTTVGATVGATATATVK